MAWCSLGGILSQGSKIAPSEAPPNSKVLGNGVYLTDTASKSGSYNDPWNSDQTGLLLGLCDPSYVRSGYEDKFVESLRKQVRSLRKRWRAQAMTRLGAATFSQWLQGTFMPGPGVPMPQPRGFRNTYIVYDIAQVWARYVFTLKWKGPGRWSIS